VSRFLVHADEKAEEFLFRLLEKDRVPHLLLFSGIKCTEKLELARQFATRWLEKITPTPLTTIQDLTILHVEGKTGMHSISSIREMITMMSLAPFSAGGKAIIIEDAERMLPTSANALLKSIEEPPRNTLIILLCEDPHKLLLTIRSRCQEIRITKVKEKGVSEFGHFVELLLSKNSTFIEVSSSSEDVQKAIEEKKKKFESQVSTFTEEEKQHFSGVQKQKLEQEIEGAIAIRTVEEVEELFCHIAIEFRALYPEYVDVLDELLRRARLQVERASPLKNALEGLFLELKRRVYEARMPHTCRKGLVLSGHNSSR
jgi:DNA polymerase III delta prime subunit